MSSSLKIRQMIFAEQGLIFEVQSSNDKEIYRCSPTDLFNNDHLLVKFNSFDVRLIAYFSAIAEYQADQKYLSNTYNKCSRS